MIYSGKGSLVDGHIRFGLGKLGGISARFKPDGSVDRLRPPKSCKGREQVVRSGAFIGSIKFRGEGGYTRLNAHRVRGAMASPRSLRFFIAGTSERHGALRISRSALVEGKPKSFDALEDLSSATVSPPKPFAGAASFKRNADGSTEWSGTLSVALPGVESTALTGPTFTANLAKPRTEREFSELFG